MIEILLDRGADIESTVQLSQLQASSLSRILPITALQASPSTQPTKHEMVQLLLARDADPETVLDVGRTALHIYPLYCEPSATERGDENAFPGYGGTTFKP